MDYCFISALLLALAHICYSIETDSKLVITNVDRTIDVSSQIIKILTKITLTNNGNKPVDQFVYSSKQNEADHLSFIGAYVRNRQNKLKVAQIKVQNTEDSNWLINLPKSLGPAAKLDVEVEVLLTNSLTPFPSSIGQKDKQLVVYKGNAYLYSKYPVTKQSTSVALGTKVIESYTQLKPSQQSNGKVLYGPFENIQPYTVEEISVHYENNSPFLSVTNMERVLEISHWGNIAVEEHIHLQHKGAILKGSFSRVDAQGPSAVKWFETVLPASARDVYYRDDIGNVSTSNLRVHSDSVHVKLQPRFPIFGGWKTKYILGYNIPTYEALYNSGVNYILKMRILDHVFDDMVVEDLTTKIILPEGALDIAVKTPFTVERLPDERHYTYLDTMGRTVVVLHMKNLVENHIQEFEVAYTYPSYFMLHEPLLLVAGVFSLLATAIFVKRLDLSLSPRSKLQRN